MTFLRFKARNHPQQTKKRGPNPSVDDRGTVPEVFDPLHVRFGFTVDVAASPENAKLPRFYSIDRDGLQESWKGERVWCNPPYSDIRPWIEKAWTGEAKLVVMILPANRTEQAWWQDLVEPYRDRYGSPLSNEFLRGRIRFLSPGKGEIGPNERPPFGSVLLIWDWNLR